MKKENDVTISFLNSSEYLSPSPSDILQAITLKNIRDSANPSDILQAITLKNIKDSFNLEKLEVIGNCLLK